MKWIHVASFVLLFAQNAFTQTLDQRETLLANRLQTLPKTDVRVRKPLSDYPAFVSHIAAHFERESIELGPGCASVRQTGSQAVQTLIATAKDSRAMELLKNILYEEEIVLAYSNVATAQIRCAVRRFRLVFADKTILTVDFH